jgi:hypothetical protein
MGTTEELFRFYTIRAPEPLPPEQAIPLDTGSPYQKELRRAQSASPQRARVLAEQALRKQADRLVSFVSGAEGQAVRRFAAWLGSMPTDASDEAFDAAVRAKITGLFDADPATLRARDAAAGTPVLVKDAVVSLRVLDADADQLQALLHTDPHVLAATLVAYVRFDRLLVLAEAPLTVHDVTATMDAKLTTQLVDLSSVANRPSIPPGPTAAEQLAKASMVLAEVGRLLVSLERACPAGLVPPPPLASHIDQAPGDVIMGPVLSEATRAALAAEFAGLPERIDGVLHPDGAGTATAASAWLLGPWRGVHARLEVTATQLQALVDALQAQLGSAPAAAPASNETPTPLAAGYMRLAGMTDVKVVRSHVVRYEGSELAQIENVLQGETRARRFRTLTRREEDTQTQTEKQVTEEKEVKTEDKSSLKSSVDETLKEGLDLKVGFDLHAKVGDVQIGLNTSFGYSRSTEESKKSASEFAKDVTNRAARKVSETVRTTIRTRLLQETEETVNHGFNAKQADANIVGLYQWINKVNRVQLFTVGDQKRMILDGVVLQPGQRLLGAPTQAGSSPPIPPPPTLEVAPSQIHPWNYLSLAAEFGASSVSAPPPLTSNVSFSGAGPQGGADEPGKEKNFGVAQELALPAGTAAAYATVSLSAAVDNVLEEEHALAVLGGQTWTTVGATGDEQVIAKSNNPREIRLSGTRILAGEQGTLPFTFFGGRVAGYAVAADVTCVRTPEAYQAWQAEVYGALRAASAKAQQDYSEQAARATLAQAYDYGPSPAAVEQTIREEIKRCVIAVLATQPSRPFYDLLKDYYASGSYTEVAQRCLFFEHALEWENLTYILYPYFWADGRNDGWTKRLTRDEKDPDLVAFLKAGAARVVVPVRPLPKDATTKDATTKDPGTNGAGTNGAGTNGADNNAVTDFSAYLQAMSLPKLEELLDVHSPLYLAMDQELKARDSAEPETFDEEWEVHVPTELVRLRPTPALPTWSERHGTDGKPIKGDWVEDQA